MNRFFLAALMSACSINSSQIQTDLGEGSIEPTVVKSELVLANPPFASCHASTLVELADGRLMVGMCGGAFDGAPDARIWGCILTDSLWSDPVILADGHINNDLSYPCYNPVLFRTKTGRLFLFYQVGPNPLEWSGRMKSSTDDGQTWSKPQQLPDGILGPTKNKPFELPGNRLLCPSSFETQARWRVQMEILDLQTNTWSSSVVDPESRYDVLQPTILNLPGGVLRILCRSLQNAIIYSDSLDNGITWQPLSSLSLPNPNSGIDGITLPDSTQLLVYNPLFASKELFQGRKKLSLAASADGLNWKDNLILEDRDAGEFSYPAIIRSRDGRIHITYTYDHKNIKYLELSLDDRNKTPFGR